MALLPLARFRSEFAEIAEGQSGYRHLTFTVELSAVPVGNVVVTFASANGSATAGEDYVARSGALTFLAGETTKTFAVRILGDLLHEAAETFTMELTRASGAGGLDITRQSVLATILNDDPRVMPAAFFVTEHAAVDEGAAGTRNLVFTVGLTEAPLTTVRVSFASGNGSARAGEDYMARVGTLVFAPGETRKTFAVPIIGDRIFEPNETFYIDLTGVTGGAMLGTERLLAIGTIVNDDAAELPSLGFAATSVAASEGDAGSKTLVFSLVLSAAAARTLRVTFETANGSAQAGVDYVARSGALSFAPGETRKNFAITLLGDTAHEADETFYLDLTSVSSGAVLDSERSMAIATIVNDDPPPMAPSAAAELWL